MREIYGDENVIHTDISDKKVSDTDSKIIFEKLDVTDQDQYRKVMEKHKINYVVHLSGILSAVGEKNPGLAMKVNGNGVLNALDMAKEFKAK
jgi:nucleoside-diphosphate-sugar epimerase